MKYKKQAKSIESIVHQLLSDNHLEEAFIFSRLNEIWKEKFFPVFNDTIKLISFNNKTLTIKASTSV